MFGSQLKPAHHCMAATEDGGGMGINVPHGPDRLALLAVRPEQFGWDVSAKFLLS
jgi:hypothetical protein